MINSNSQISRVELIGEINGEELIGKKVTNPVTGSLVLILPASFVCPEMAAE